MYSYTTYRSAGAETSGPTAAIDMLLLWSKEMRFGSTGSISVQLNLRDEPISNIELTLYKEGNLGL